jgi:hypothetical protein
VQDYWVKRELGRNLAYREGWHVYIGRNGALMIIPKEAHDGLREILRDREKISENELKRAGPYQILFVLDLTIVLEYLVFHEITLRTFNYKLDQGLPESFKKVVKLEEEISKTLDEFLNSYAWSRSIVKEWVKYGKNKMEIDEKYESIRRRLDTIKDGIEIAYKISVDFTNFLLALLATYIGLLSLREILPSWLVNSVTLMIFFFLVVVLIVLTCRPIWRWLWKHCGRLKGQSRRIYKAWILFKMCPYAIIEVNAMIIVPLNKIMGGLRSHLSLLIILPILFSGILMFLLGDLEALKNILSMDLKRLEAVYKTFFPLIYFIIVLSIVLRYLTVFIAIGAACLIALLIWETLKESKNTRRSLKDLIGLFLLESFEILIVLLNLGFLNVTWSILGLSGYGLSFLLTTMIMLINIYMFDEWNLMKVKMEAQQTLERLLQDKNKR